MSIATAKIREQIEAFAKKSPSPHMIQDFIRWAVTRVLQDKILLGLIIVGILGIFVSGINSPDEPPIHKQAEQTSGQLQSRSQGRVMQSADKDNQAAQSQVAQEDVSKLRPGLACEFVKWWVGSAMDYTAASAEQNHKEAFRWMTPEAVEAFRSYFWSQAVSSGVTSGSIVANFQPIAVQALAINPDGSVVVALSGTIVMQGNDRPITQPVLADFLVRQEKDGLRVAALHNKTATYPGNTIF